MNILALINAKYGFEWGEWRSIDTLGQHGVGLWKYITRGGSCFLATPNLIREMGSRLDFGMMCGVEVQLSRKLDAE